MARKYARDNRGRFASKGSGATARGGRLKTAGGNKREGQTMQVKGAGGSKLRNRTQGQLQNAASKGDKSALAALNAQRKGPLKPARKDSKGQGWGTGLDRGGAPKRAFAKAPAGTISKPKGLKPGAVKAKPQTTAKTPLKRTGQRTAVPVMKTNTERGRQGIVSMSANAKQARRGAVAERKAEKQARISERATGIVARRQGRREMTYNPDGSFNQSAARLNQSKESNSKRLQRWLTTRDPAAKPVSKAKPASRPDTAMVNIPMSGSRGRRLDAEISRNVKAQKAQERAASKALGRKVKAETSRAKKLRNVHEKAVVAKYAKKMNKPADEVRSAIRSLTPDRQIKFFKQWVKENRTATRRR